MIHWKLRLDCDECGSRLKYVDQVPDWQVDEERAEEIRAAEEWVERYGDEARRQMEQTPTFTLPLDTCLPEKPKRVTFSQALTGQDVSRMLFGGYTYQFTVRPERSQEPPQEPSFTVKGVWTINRPMVVYVACPVCHGRIYVDLDAVRIRAASAKEARA